MAPLIDPSTGEAFAEAPVSGRPTWTGPLRVAADAFTSWRRTTPSERSLALIRIADALEVQRRGPGPGRVREHRASRSN